MAHDPCMRHRAIWLSYRPWHAAIMCTTLVCSTKSSPPSDAAPSHFPTCSWVQVMDSYRNTGGFDMLGAGRDKIESPDEFAVRPGDREGLKGGWWGWGWR
jgi:hypothetical protein